jgi:hypothetical protein
MKKAILVLATLALSACTYVSPETKANIATTRIASALDLTKEQKAKAHEIKDMYLEARKAGYLERREQFDKTKQLIASEKLDPSQIKTMIAQRTKRFDLNFEPIFSKVSDLHATLSAEQKKEALELMDKYSQFWD